MFKSLAKFYLHYTNPSGFAPVQQLKEELALVQLFAGKQKLPATFFSELGKLLHLNTKQRKG